MAVNNSARSSPSFCLICIQCISDEQINEIYTSLTSRPLLDLEKIIQVFCDYMDFNKTIRFGSYNNKACPGPGEIFPYCKKCLEQILELYEFHQERKRLTDLIAKSVCCFTAKIVENPLDTLEDIKLYWSTRKSTETDAKKNTDSLLSIDEIKTEKDDLDLSLEEENLALRNLEDPEGDPCIKIGSVTQPSSFFLNEWIDLRKEIINRYSVEVSVRQTNDVSVAAIPIPTKSMIPVAPNKHIATAADEGSKYSREYDTCKQELDEDEDMHEEYFSDADRSDCDIESNLSRPMDSDFDGNDGESDFDLGTARNPEVEAEAADDVDITDFVNPPPTVLRKSQRIRNSLLPKDNSRSSVAEEDEAAADFVPLPIALRKPQRSRRKVILLPKVKDDVKLDPSWNPGNYSFLRSEREAGQNPPAPKPRLVKKIGPNQFAVGDFTFEKVDDLYKCGSCEHSTVNRPNIVCHMKDFHLNPNPLKKKPAFWWPKSAKEIDPNKFALGSCTFEKVGDVYQCGSCVYFNASRKNIIRHVKYGHLKPRPETTKTGRASIYRPRIVKEIGENRFSVGDFTFQKIDQLYKCGSCLYSNPRRAGIIFHLKHYHLKPSQIRLLEVSPDDYMYANKFPASKVFDMYKCGTCEFMTEKMDSLKKHLSTHLHPNPLPKPKNNICEICGKAFTKLYMLRAHIRSHSEDRRFTCEVCANTYKSLSGLNIHMESHTGEDTKKCVCEVCGYKTRTQHQLGNHMAKHYKGGTIYSCDECDRKYTWPAGLSTHKKQEHDPKGMIIKYPCEYCDMKFKVKSSVPRHVRVVHFGEKSQNVFKRTGERNPELKEDRNETVVPSSSDVRVRIPIPYGEARVQPKTDDDVNDLNSYGLPSSSEQELLESVQA